MSKIWKVLKNVLGQSKSSADPVVKAAAAAAPEPAVKAAAAAGAAEPLVKAAAATAPDPLAKAAAAGASEPLVKAAAASVSEPAVKSSKTSKFDVAENSSLSEKSLLNPLSVAETAAEAGSASSSLDIKLESPSSPQPMPRDTITTPPPPPVRELDLSLLKKVAPHVPLIKFGRKVDESPMQPVEEINNPAVPVLQSATSPASSRHWWDVPTRFRRPTISEQECEVINSGGADQAWN